MTLIHSRLSFGLLVRAAKRSGALRYYRRTAHSRIAVLNGGTVHVFRGQAGDESDWARPYEHDGATDAGDAHWREDARRIAE